MSVQFNEPNLGGGYGNQPQNRFPEQGQSSAMIRMVMKMKLAKDEETANKVLLATAIIFFIITAIVLFSSF